MHRGYMGQDAPPTAVIDIGSGSARAVVMQVHEGGGIEVLAQQRMNLELMSRIGPDGTLERDALALTLAALEDFIQVCLAHGVQSINAVGTAALRESQNASEIIGEVGRKFGVTFRIISGEDEAAYCFIGGVHGLPVTNGMLADLGGGSMEVVSFADRTLESGPHIATGEPADFQQLPPERPAVGGRHGDGGAAHTGEPGRRGNTVPGRFGHAGGIGRDPSACCPSWTGEGRPTRS